jgi:hypothetical protein
VSSREGNQVKASGQTGISLGPQRCGFIRRLQVGGINLISARDAMAPKRRPPAAAGAVRVPAVPVSPAPAPHAVRQLSHARCARARLAPLRRALRIPVAVAQPGKLRQQRSKTLGDVPEHLEHLEVTQPPRRTSDRARLSGCAAPRHTDLHAVSCSCTGHRAEWRGRRIFGAAGGAAWSAPVEGFMSVCTAAHARTHACTHARTHTCTRRRARARTDAGAARGRATRPIGLIRAWNGGHRASRRGRRRSASAPGCAQCA